MMMNNKLKLQNIFIWSVRIVLGFCLGIILFAIIYSNTETFQTKVKEVITKEFKNHVVYERAGLDIFPSLGLVLYKVNVSVPERNHVKVESLKLHSRFFHLIAGKLKIKKFTLKKPDILLDISKKQKEKTEKDYSAPEIIEHINSVIEEIRSAMPGLVTVIKDGKLIVREDNQDISDVQKLNARFALAPKDVKIRIKGNLQKWEKISLVGRFYAQKDTVFIDDLSALFGQSSITHCSGKIKFNDSSYLELKSGKTVLIILLCGDA